MNLITRHHLSFPFYLFYHLYLLYHLFHLCLPCHLYLPYLCHVCLYYINLYTYYSYPCLDYLCLCFVFPFFCLRAFYFCFYCDFSTLFLAYSSFATLVKRLQLIICSNVSILCRHRAYEVAISAQFYLCQKYGTSFIVNDDSRTVDFSMVCVLVCCDKVFVGVELNETVASGVTLSIFDDSYRFDDSIFLADHILTSNSYFSYFSVVL